MTTAETDTITPRRTITIGDDDPVSIRPFKGYKAIHVGKIVAEIMRAVPDIAEQAAIFTRKFEHDNALVITRDMSHLPQFQNLGMTAEDWDACGGRILVPQDAPMELVVASVFPSIVESAETKLMRLLAWVITPDADLRTADDDGSVDDVIAASEKRLLHDASLDQLIDVAVVAVEVIREQFAAGKADRLAGLISRVMGRPDESQNGSTPAATATAETEASTTPPTPATPSSTDSLTPTDGPATPSSTVSGGVT